MATTNRDWADKGWLKPEPEEQTPFVVRVMNAGAAIAIVLALIVIVLVSLAAISRAKADERAGADWKVFLPLYFRNRDPINPPRCPRENARGEALDYGIAMQPDGTEWLIDCRYVPAAVRF